MTKKSILIATIGTRDLAFLTSEKEWLTVGNDRNPDLDTPSQQVRVQYDLELDTPSFRRITQHLYEQWEKYYQRLQPIIIGKLLEDECKNLAKIYLVATNQPSITSEKFRDKDTIYAAKIIKNYIEQKYEIPTEIVEQCTEGENPSDFDAMFAWWQKLWKELEDISDRSILLCLKGGVNQSSEAARITALTQFEDDCIFYDFHEDESINKKGQPSYYTKVSGGNYLWERRQKQALKLLERYDYAGAWEIIEPYFKPDTKIAKFLKAGIEWNQGRFEQFSSIAKSNLSQYLSQPQKKQLEEYWWMAYEQAYTAVVRLEQKNTTEAMLHSFRAIEGLIYKWMENKFSEHFIKPNKIQSSICSALPDLKSCFNGDNEINLEGWVQQKLVEAAFPEAKKEDSDFQAWGAKKARDERNRLSHQLGGISEEDLFRAWGEDITSKSPLEGEKLTNYRNRWKKRILNCLNLITGKQFDTLAKASLFAHIHEEVKKAIADHTDLLYLV